MGWRVQFLERGKKVNLLLYKRSHMWNRLGMRKKKKPTNRDQIAQIYSLLESHPEMAERMLSILKIADEPVESGKIRSADEIESLISEELRLLGNETVSTWAGSVDESISAAFKAENPRAQLREKKTSNGGLDSD